MKKIHYIITCYLPNTKISYISTTEEVDEDRLKEIKELLELAAKGKIDCFSMNTPTGHITLSSGLLEKFSIEIIYEN